MLKSAPEPPTENLIRFEPTPRGLALIALALGLAWAVLKLAPVLLVLIVALFLVGTLNPIVEWLEKKSWRRGWAIGCVFAVMLVSTLALLVVTIPSLIAQVMALVKLAPGLRMNLVELLARSKATAPLAQSLGHVDYEAIAKSSAVAALGYSSHVLEVIAYLASAFFLALYIMIDRDRLRGGLFALVPRTHHIRLSRVLLNLETIVGGYIRGQGLTSLLMAIFTGILLFACGVPNALALAVFAGIADILPYLGTFLSIGPALAGAASRGLGVVVIVLVTMLAYEEFESRFLVPKIYGNALRLPSSVVLFALLAGGTLLGITGALLALPAAAAVRMLITELRVALPGETHEDPQVRARDERAEQEYEQRSDGIPVAQAAAIAVEISEQRQDEEGGAEQAAEDALEKG